MQQRMSPQFDPFRTLQQSSKISWKPEEIAITAIKLAAGGLAKFMCRKKKEQMEVVALMKKPSLHPATDLSKIRSIQDRSVPVRT